MRAVAANPADHRAGITLAKTYLFQGRLILAQSGPAAALPVLKKSVALSESLTDAFGDDHLRLSQIGNAYGALAEVFGYLGRPREAAAALDKVIGACESYAKAHPGDPKSYRAQCRVQQRGPHL